MSAPDVSVVIPTRNRATRLRFALEALREQSLDPSRFEVIVVLAEDSAEPAPEAPEGLAVRFLECPPGPARQRNLGWRQARAALVAFTDDDCRPAPDWLPSLLGAATSEGEPDRILQGPTIPDPDERHLLHGRARSIEVERVDGWFPTCNIAYPRALLERVGGFDESFPTAWGEDTDLGHRALDAGAEATFVERALVRHAVNPRTLRQALADARRRDDLPRVLARHPRQRKQLYLGLFTRTTHARLLLAVLGVLVARRHPLIGAAALYPYLSNRRTPSETLRDAAQILVRLPGRVAIDATEVAVTARAALEHRVPVL